MTRRPTRGSAASPLLVGAATVLVIIVSVLLAYNANRGLPFVPTYRLSAELPNAASLVPGNEVRIGGSRVGVIDRIEPVAQPDGDVRARLGLRLDTSVRPLPADSTFIVRSRSALGLKYLELTLGSASRSLPDGGLLRLERARPEPVEIDELFNTFDQPTRAAIRRNLTEFGTGLAARGPELNAAIESLAPLLRSLEPVMANLADPATRLDRLFRSLGRAAAEVAPVAEVAGELFAHLDTTFAGLAAVARPHLQAAISKGPPTLDTAIETLPSQRTFLRNAEGLMADLRPGVRALRRNSGDLSGALVTGTPALTGATGLNRRLERSFVELERFSGDPIVDRGIAKLTETVTTLNPTLDFVTPAQTVCNYMTLWFRNVSSLLSIGDGKGTWQRFIIIATPLGPNSEGGPSSAPAAGPSRDNYLHSNPYPNTAAPGQTRECEAANEDYSPGKVAIGNVAGNQGATTEGQRR